MPDLEDQLRIYAEAVAHNVPPVSAGAAMALADGSHHGARLRLRAGLLLAAAAIAVFAAVATVRTVDPQSGDVIAGEPDRTETGPKLHLLAPNPVIDGAQLTIAGSDFLPDTEINLTTCIGNPNDKELRGESWPASCDIARGFQIRSDGNGTIDDTVTAYADILTYDGWRSCQPCVLRAFTSGQVPTLTSLAIKAIDTSIRPTVTIAPAGPYIPGQQVTLSGTGFRHGVDLTIGWCAFRTDNPETEVQGDPANGSTACQYPIRGFNVVVDESGGFVLTAFPLPKETFYLQWCDKPGIRCGIASQRSEGAPSTFFTLFDLDR